MYKTVIRTRDSGQKKQWTSLRRAILLLLVRS
jgi:hypothetical protein